MRFESKLDGFLVSSVEEKLNRELVEQDILKEHGSDVNVFEIDYTKYDYNRIKVKDNHVVIAEHKVVKEYKLEETDRYGVWLREGVVSHIKLLDTETIYTVSYNYIATSKSDDIEDLRIEELGSEEEMKEILLEQYRGLDRESIEIEIDGIRAKVIKKSLDNYKKETSMVLNF